MTYIFRHIFVIIIVYKCTPWYQSYFLFYFFVFSCNHSESTAKLVNWSLIFWGGYQKLHLGKKLCTDIHASSRQYFCTRIGEKKNKPSKKFLVDPSIKRLGTSVLQC